MTREGVEATKALRYLAEGRVTIELAAVRPGRSGEPEGWESWKRGELLRKHEERAGEFQWERYEWA